jgi:hypothetical protein
VGCCLSLLNDQLQAGCTRLRHCHHHKTQSGTAGWLHEFSRGSEGRGIIVPGRKARSVSSRTALLAGLVVRSDDVNDDRGSQQVHLSERSTVPGVGVVSKGATYSTGFPPQRCLFKESIQMLGKKRRNYGRRSCCMQQCSAGQSTFRTGTA